MFNAVGLALHKGFAVSLGKEMLEAVRREYIDKNTLTVKSSCQTAQAMAIYYDIFTEEEKPGAFKVLMDIIKNDGNEFTCGFLGTRVLFHVLAKYGEEELAYRMITGKEFPSYGYWLDKGETTFLENFYMYDEYFGGSKNHHFFGDVVNWFMSVIGGLCVQSPTRVKISPHFITELDCAKASHKLPLGEVKVHWERKTDDIIMDISAPYGVECSISLNKERYKVENLGDNKYFIKAI